MAQPLNLKMDRFASRLADFAIRWRWPVIAIGLLLALAAGSGVRLLEFSNNYRALFGPENPELVAFESFQATYTKNDNILFVLQPSSGRVFSPSAIDAVEKLTAAAWKIPFAIRVDSITNFQHSWADGDDLTVEALIVGGAELPQADLDRRGAIALAEPLLHGNLISPDAVTTGINVTLQYPEKSFEEVPEAVSFARNLADQIRQEFPELHIALTGLSMMNNAFTESGQQDARNLVPLMYLILILIIVLTLRSVGGTVSTLVVVFFSTFTAMGLAGYLGIVLSPISVMAPTIILTLAIADSIHILTTLQEHMREGQDKLAALKDSLRINFLPVTITSLTTLIGFLSLNFSDAPPFRDLGNITAIGIGAAWLFSLTLLPALVCLLPYRVKQGGGKGRGLTPLLDWLADFVITRHRGLLAVMGAATIILVALVPTIDLNDEFVKYFDHRVPFRTDTDFAIANLTGIYIVEYSVEAGEAGGISSPDYLQNLEKMTGWLREQPEVKHVYSYTDIIKRLNKNMHGDDPVWYQIPRERDLAAQYLLLYELSLPFGLDLNDRINIDKSATRLSANLGDLSTVKMRNFLTRFDAWQQQNIPETLRSSPTGASVMFANISKRNIESMLGGNALALLLISGILVLSLRSFGLGVLSLLPNTIPILMTFGLWALLVGQVGMAAATVTSTSLGIVVDDTVHFLSKYLLARREKGYSRPEAVRYAFHTVGRAIVFTTVILTIGFAVLTASTFLVNFQMGVLTAITILVALAADFLLLPSLLLFNYQNEKVKSDEKISPLVNE